MRDEIFKKKLEKQFEFDDSVASVFDDMINRSVPFYELSSNLSCEILSKLLPNNSKVLDLGCSTASNLILLGQSRKDLDLTGVDNSSSMILAAKRKIKAFGLNIKLDLFDILDYEINDFSAIICAYTLQFIRPIQRPYLLDKIYKGLKPNSYFILSEKIIFSDSKFSKNITEIYENYKLKQGYSSYEISQKRQALENILVPYSEDENKKMLFDCGFDRVESFFKWGNFMSFIAFKY